MHLVSPVAIAALALAALPAQSSRAQEQHWLLQGAPRWQDSLKDRRWKRNLSKALLEQPDFETVEVQMPWADGNQEPLVRCPGKTDAAGEPGIQDAESNLRQAVITFCQVGLGSLVEFYVDPRFERNHERLRGPDGWIDEAYLTYMGLRDAHDKIAAEEDLLAQSVRHFSNKTLVVANFNTRVPRHWDPDQYPNMVLMHARSSTTIHQSFNFNKLTAMLFSKVKSGMVLDADQFVNQGVDSMLQRASEETTHEYPFPIMPVHWMSRDPDSDDMTRYPPGYTWNFKSKDAPARTMRWGQAHPTWSYPALPWLARWTAYVLAPAQSHPPNWLQEQGHLEDEDLLNVALWAEGARKQWCRFDLDSPSMFADYLQQQGQQGLRVLGRDKKFYPRGIAHVYFTAHDAKKPVDSYSWLSKLWLTNLQRKVIRYDGRWFGTGTELKDYDPSLKCIV
eukprot:TRINITY_DN11812_c0_g1_i1.p1 TRINITY_DN11812_c0_g1~~TRINITY_DN11812_c0_g1_i1.p1  ORF type:complete len:449 (-),score=65.48 TRINITY_DN11812_c0_g1_i1:117-1463(-)